MVAGRRKTVGGWIVTISFQLDLLVELAWSLKHVWLYLCKNYDEENFLQDIVRVEMLKEIPMEQKVEWNFKLDLFLFLSRNVFLRCMAYIYIYG